MFWAFLVFSLREVPSDGFTDSKNNSRANDVTRDKAAELDVDLAALAKGISKLRNDCDPVLSSKLIQSLYQVGTL